MSRVLITETAMPGVLVLTPDRLTDERGAFFEALRTDALEPFIGRPFTPRQVNYSVSRDNTLRGIHSVTVPPGQAKFVTCVRGALRDIVVDLRVGSPTFGEYVVHILDAVSGTSIYIPEGMGHGFLSLADDTCICYLLSEPHVPGTQVDINPLDPDLALPWGFVSRPMLSAKDAAAPSVAEAAEVGLLADWHAVRPSAALQGRGG